MISPITSLAILKVNSDVRNKDYVDNFVPIIAECVRLSPHDVVSIQELQQQVRDLFKLNLPQNVINYILRRAAKQKYVKIENGVFIRNQEVLSELRFQSVQQRIVAEHEAVVRRLAEFCLEKFNVKWNIEEADEALHAYIQEHQILVIGSTTQSVIVPITDHSTKRSNYLVGSFIQYLQETHASEFAYLETIVKGNLLANAIFLPDILNAPKKFRFTELYFDTTFLIRAMGYAGPPREAPCTELLQLAVEAGAELRCLRHTLEEVRQALDTNASIIHRGRINEVYGGSIETVEYFLSQGYTPSDIRLLATEAEEKLQTLRIRVVDKPSYGPNYSFNIDEKSLADVLRTDINYRNELALNRDVDSIAAVMRLRRGRESFSFEDCRALFVTTNSRLVSVTRNFFYPEATPRTISPAMTDYTLTNFLWLKKPTQAPDLPRKRIIADYYAATQPDEQLWRLYLLEIEKLKQRGTVTSEQYYLLRHSLHAKEFLMELTLGQEEAFVQGTVPEILARVQANIQGEVQASYKERINSRDTEIKTLSEDIDMVLSVLQDKEEKEQSRATRIRERARKFAKTISWLLTVLAVVLVAIATYFTLPGQLLELTGWKQYILTILFASLLILSVGNLVFGTTLITIIHKIEEYLSRYVEKLLLSVAE